MLLQLKEILPNGTIADSENGLEALVTLNYTSCPGARSAFISSFSKYCDRQEGFRE